MSSSSLPDKEQYDPTFVHARREAIVIFCAWLVGLLWAVPFCYYFGYNVEPEDVTTVLGIPTWLFWGIAVPWIAADIFTTWFCFCFMKDDDLGETAAAEDIPEKTGEAEA